jgi:tRNA A37 N6-isopentenylltransferase MiaA
VIPSYLILDVYYEENATGYFTSKWLCICDRMRRVNWRFLYVWIEKECCLSRDMILEKIKQYTLAYIKRQTPFSDLVHDQKNYYLESVTSSAQIIPLYDEQVKLNELK